MKTIFRDNADRISVADAKRLILEALPPERSAEVYARVDENGDIDFEGPLELREVHGVQIYASFIDRDFLPICEQLSIQPRMRYRPVFTNYTWKSSEDDALYTIAHDEFSRVTELFGLTVAIGQAPEPQAAPVVTEIDFTMLATRGALVDAFGNYTGMDESWFDNVKDAPKLKAARKVAGQGGRGHITEPWFCPYEVMQWLADEKRRKGRKVSESKAWELLETHFPKVYNTYSIGDPRSN